MGRRKLNESPSVGDKKKLMKDFNKKKSFIFKKTYELSTLCDIPACVIIYGPNGDEPPCVWPEEAQGFNSVLARYMNTSSEKRKKRAMVPKKLLLEHDQVLDAGNANKLKIEKLGNTGLMWDDRINSLSSEELMGLVNQLNSKLDIVNSRIDVMKKAIQNSAKLESEELYHAAAAEEQKMMMIYNMQTMQSLQQYQCQQDYLRYVEEQRQQTEMNQMIQGGFYNVNNNNNVNLGDYNNNGFMGGNLVNVFPMCDPTPLACYDPRTQLPHQSHTTLLRDA
ncbi:MADS-box transcription factor PHERES 2-like [Silene latifolia]|uniref:MADS-box transcription factor PHERES 2-like n=1 Tax=Silene latifolia TaxID=37657 RepID=UPI003D785803